MVPNPMGCCRCLPRATSGFEEPEEPVAFRRYLMGERFELGFAVVFGGLEVVEVPKTIQSHKPPTSTTIRLVSHPNPIIPTTRHAHRYTGQRHQYQEYLSMDYGSDGEYQCPYEHQGEPDTVQLFIVSLPGDISSHGDAT